MRKLNIFDNKRKKFRDPINNYRRGYYERFFYRKLPKIILKNTIFPYFQRHHTRLCNLVYTVEIYDFIYL